MPPVRETGDRIIHFIEGAGFGWGNQVRGMVFATLYAVLTDRRLVMDPNSKYVKHFRFPARGAPLRLASNAGDRKRLDQGECEQDPAKCLEFKQRVIEHASGVTMDQRYTRTPAIRDKLKRLFGTDNHALISYCVVRWLFQSPRPLFLEAAAAYRDRLGHTATTLNPPIAPTPAAVNLPPCASWPALTPAALTPSHPSRPSSSFDPGPMSPPSSNS